MIMFAFKKAGFHAQQRVRMLLQKPPTIESTPRVGDCHADSRLLYLSPNHLSARGMVKGLSGNQWRMCSELARTTGISTRPMVPNPSDLLHVTDDEPVSDGSTTASKINKEDKAAQRGPQVAQAYLEALFSKATVVSTDYAPVSWIQPGEATRVLDLTPWAGDRGKASLNLMDEAYSKYGIIRHVFVDLGYKRLGQGASFSHARVANEVANQSMARTRVLHDYVQDTRGQITIVAKQPLGSVPQPNEDVLKQTPGAYEAWQGLSKMDLKVCVVRGPKITISPEKLAEFQHAPLSISEEVRRLEAEHREYEERLAFMASASTKPEPESDPRPGNGDDKPKADSTAYVTMASLAALEAFAPGLIENQCTSNKHVSMYKDEKRREVWLLSRGDDHIMPKGTVLGGYGGGQMSGRKADRLECVPWCLPDGDKTYVQIATGEEGENKTKPKVGTLYSLIKPLERAAAQKGAEMSLSSYGKIEAKGQAGKHGFGFECPEGHPKHTPQDYILTTAKAGAKTTTSGNFFANLAIRDGWAGLCGTMWRLAHDPVRHMLHAR
jgi:hypothetical protein